MRFKYCTKPQKYGGNKQLPNINGKPLQYLEKEKGLCIISSKIERKNKYWFEQTWPGVYFLKYWEKLVALQNLHNKNISVNLKNLK